MKNRRMRRSIPQDSSGRRIKAGSYIRVCRLLEKLCYGGEQLEPYEERVVKSFLEKLLHEAEHGDLKMRLAIRYRHCTNSVRICQIKNV